MRFVVRPPPRVNHRPIRPRFHAVPMHLAVGPLAVVLVSIRPHVHAFAVHFAVLELALVLPGLLSAPIDPRNLALSMNQRHNAT